MSAAEARAQVLLADTEKSQAQASDPTASAWVSANAGAGKTHVLKQRVLRILLAGTPPDRILCLTYTKAAAAEMAGRVFADLSRWATATTPRLSEALARVLSRQPTEAEIAAARTLFARAIETPGGLKVQTIHAFCERLLQRFPLEAQVPPGFVILDDAEGARIVREATDATLAEATREREGELGRALQRVVTFAAGDAFDERLRAALGCRDWLAEVVRGSSLGRGGEDVIATAYRRALGVRDGLTPAGLAEEMAAVLGEPQLRRAAQVLGASTKSKNDQDLASGLLAALAAGTIGAKVTALVPVFLTGQRQPRSDRLFVTKAVREANPDVHQQMVRARDRFAALDGERLGLEVAEASRALMRLAAEVMQRYHELKSVRAALDFEDLVVRTAGLLSSSDAAAWVLLKLDGGLDHILVDEAQDTSPLQWQVIEALAGEFFPATGGQVRPRTIFAVGDEKQSIYSFQGAEPRMFADTGRRFAEAAKAARLDLVKVPLRLSFRTVEPLLAAVDRVLADRSRTPGLMSGDDEIKHEALRLGAAGCLEIWETEKPLAREDVDAWDPLGEASQPSPVVRLADRIADTIQAWLAREEPLASEGRPVRAGDILILLRRRRPFGEPMVAALKKRGIPVAGADRLLLTQQIAVQDLMVLGDFLTLPEDDLALATVLKSPLFDLDDDDLLVLTTESGAGTLWTRLLSAARTRPRFQEAAETLRRWRGIADQSPPFELYAHVLDRDGGRRRLIARLGPESVDPITELLNLAVEFDEREPPSLTGFLEWLRSGSREVKRDMEHGRDEVRILTVHGSKGLEAPIVFLPDTCSAVGGNRQGRLVRLAGSGLAGDRAAPVAWPVKGTTGHPAVEAATAAAKAAEVEESNRLLYVAMTRARDRLYVTGWEGGRGPAPGCWYDLISTGLRDTVHRVEDAEGRAIRRLACAQTAPPAAARELAAAVAVPQRPPAWADAPAPRERRLAVPLAPSRLAPYDVDDSGDPSERAPVEGEAPAFPPSPSPLQLAGSYRFQRGLVTHALLEHLPTLPQETWAAAAQAFADTRGAVLPAAVRTSIVSEVLAVLREPAFADAFGPQSRAEVPIVAEIAPPSGKGQPLLLNAVVDRLVVTSQEIAIIDYKTNRPPPRDPADVAAAYLLQLAAYRCALGCIHPGRKVRAAILWTDGARLMEIPGALLDAAERQLWELSDPRLDV